MDPLTETLRALRFSSVVFCRLTGGTPWGLSVPNLGGASFHVVLKGGCHVSQGEIALQLQSGDVVLLPKGTAQIISDQRGRTPTPLSVLQEKMRKQRSIIASLGPPPESSIIVCGAFFFDRVLWDPLLSFLPDAVHLRRPDYAQGLLDSLVAAVASELSSERSGSELVMSRLGDVLIVEILRAAIDRGLGSDQASWARAMMVPQLSKAIHEIHADLSRKWTIDALARIAGLSRSAFTAQFRAAAGMSPLEYLTHWRMVHAAGMLEDTQAPLVEVAEAVGYASEVSFNKVFRSIVGVPPGRYRSEAAARRGPVALSSFEVGLGT